MTAMKTQTSPKQFIRIADLLVSKGYGVGHKIGEGTYSKVRTAERIKGGEMCAVKIIDLDTIKRDYLKKFLPRELEIIVKLKHENVMLTYEVIHTRNYIFQIMKYADNGDVLQLIHRGGPVKEELSKSIFNGICLGLEYLHDMNIAHRDIKCENILLTKNNTAVISDFGFARSFELGKRNIFCNTFCGSTAYSAPELLRGIPYDPKLNDVWGIGVVLFIMLCATMPFDDSNVLKMVEKQLAKAIRFPPKFDTSYSKSCESCISEILEPDVNKRKSIQDILKIKWIRKECPEREHPIT